MSCILHAVIADTFECTHTCSDCSCAVVLRALTLFLSICCSEQLFSVCHDLDVIHCCSLNTTALVCYVHYYTGQTA
jgi:hypothetical protein